jgi:hypothetical protein
VKEYILYFSLAYVFVPLDFRPPYLFERIATEEQFGRIVKVVRIMPHKTKKALERIPRLFLNLNLDFIIGQSRERKELGLQSINIQNGLDLSIGK